MSPGFDCLPRGLGVIDSTTLVMVSVKLSSVAVWYDVVSWNDPESTMSSSIDNNLDSTYLS